MGEDSFLHKNTTAQCWRYIFFFTLEPVGFQTYCRVRTKHPSDSPPVVHTKAQCGDTLGTPLHQEITDKKGNNHLMRNLGKKGALPTSPH